MHSGDFAEIRAEHRAVDKKARLNPSREQEGVYIPNPVTPKPISLGFGIPSLSTVSVQIEKPEQWAKNRNNLGLRRDRRGTAPNDRKNEARKAYHSCPAFFVDVARTARGDVLRGNTGNFGFKSHFISYR